MDYYDSTDALSVYKPEFTKEDKKEAKNVFSRCHFALFAYAAVSSVLMTIALVLAGRFLTDYIPNPASDPVFILAMQVLVAYIISYPVLYLMTRKLDRSEREKSTIGFGTFLCYFFVLSALMIAGSLLSGQISGNLVFGLGVMNTMSSFITETPLYMVILVVVILGPIFEELIFRKIFIDRMSIYGDRLAVIVTSISFGLFHGNIEQFFYATFMGFALGHVYTKTRRIIYPILLHMLANFFGSVPVILMQDSIDRLSGVTDMSALEGQLLTDALVFTGFTFLRLLFAFIGIIVMIVAIFKSSTRFSKECEIRIPPLKRPGIAFFNSGTMLFYFYSIILILAGLFIDNI